MAPKVKGVKNSENKPLTLQRPILKHPERSFYVVFFLLKFQHDLLDVVPIAF